MPLTETEIKRQREINWEQHSGMNADQIQLPETVPALLDLRDRVIEALTIDGGDVLHLCVGCVQESLEKIPRDEKPVYLEAFTKRVKCEGFNCKRQAAFVAHFIYERGDW